MNASIKNDKPVIGITLGDLNGIGPEVVIKALHDGRILSQLTPVVYGSARSISFYKKMMNLEDFAYSQVKGKGHFMPKTVNVINCWEDLIEITPGKPSPATGNAALLSLKQAAQDLKEGLIDALVTAPVDKSTMHTNEFPYKGHTEFLAAFFGTSEYLMLMVSEKLRVGIVTGHIPVKEVASMITRDRIAVKLMILEQTLQKDFGVSKPKIAVLGLNPHAGDDGLIGTEEETIIKPLIHELRNKNKLVYGPFSADGFFASGQHTRYDATLAMYHDQGLIPFKALAFESGVNFTAGLPTIRTSPDHGTGYTIAGKNQALEGSMRQALYTALDIVHTRKELSSMK